MNKENEPAQAAQSENSGRSSRQSQAGRASRRGQRAAAFQILYGLHFSEITDAFALAQAFANSPDQHDAHPPDENGMAPYPQGFAWELVHGVWAKQTELDEVISAHSRNWKIGRMGRVELTLLRMAVYELLFLPDTPPKVIINEALELMSGFGDRSARGFINGVLDAVAREKRSSE